MSSKDEQMMCFESISGSSMSKEMNLQDRLLYTYLSLSCLSTLYFQSSKIMPSTSSGNNFIPIRLFHHQSSLLAGNISLGFGEIDTFLVPSCAYIISLVLYFLKVKGCFLNTNKWVTMTNLPIWMGYVIIAMIFISTKKAWRTVFDSPFLYPPKMNKSLSLPP